MVSKGAKDDLNTLVKGIYKAVTTAIEEKLKTFNDEHYTASPLFKIHSDVFDNGEKREGMLDGNG
ncbi:hypothetical protein BKK49_09230 [Rodentibacter rarus]|uniref:Uncharacterized protein n=1 Tax=Rodentibacter rarus TaxID=1908260 RepID=A0A1V3IL26_9PAST|nr:hypothetical protein [Rodentibacter rarus]OOF38694.1 hypothetical protein BKK49_09230 [Rodentibacter rarus]OOF42581.1 hypothetical protein BKK50_06615 [Rodentibacter rarus]